MAGLSGLHHVALSVKDLDVSAAWYRDVLGLEEELVQESEDRRSLVMRLPASTQQLGLVEHKATQDGGFTPRNLGLDHVAFAVASGQELEDWAARFSQRGVVSSGVIETPFGGMLFFTDPDGIALALFWNR